MPCSESGPSWRRAALAGPLPAAIERFSDEEPVEVEGWAAHLVVSGDPRPVMDAYRVQADAAGFEAVSADDARIPTPVATEWTPLPTDGEAFGQGYAGGIEPFLLEPGSRLAGAPGPNECTNEGYRAILTIDGNARDVFDRYIAQADENGEGAGPISRTQATGRGPIRTHVAGGGGADSYALTLYELDGSPPVLIVDTCTG